MYQQMSTLDNTAVMPFALANTMDTPALIWRGNLLGNTTAIGENSPRFLEISFLPSYRVNVPIKINITPDDDGWRVETQDMPLYAFGDTYNEAIANIQQAIESLYVDLMEDDDFSPLWLRVKENLRTIVRPL